MYGGSETTDLYLKHLILEDFYNEEMLKLQLQTYVTSIQGKRRSMRYRTGYVLIFSARLICVQERLDDNDVETGSGFEVLQYSICSSLTGCSHNRL